MAKNMIQFQKGMSIPEFMDNYGTEQQCRDTLFKLRWPMGLSAQGATIKPIAKLREKDGCNVIGAVIKHL